MEEDLEVGKICQNSQVVSGSAALLGAGDQLHAFSTKPRTAVTSTVQRLRSCSSSESEEEKNELSDDDDYGVPAKIPAAQPSSAAACSAGAAADARPVRGRRKNNIWSSVAQEQSMSTDLLLLGGVDQQARSDRSVESYDYVKAQKMRRRLEEEEGGARSSPAFDTSGYDEEAGNLDDLETFGTGPIKKRTVKEEEEENAGDQPVNKEGRKKWKRRHRDNGGTESKGTVKSRLGKRTPDPSKDRSHIKVTVEDSSEVVSREIMRVLDEPEHMYDTFKRLVDTVGAGEALDLLYVTEDIESEGGMMTVDNSRKRTPGGIYLFLAKRDFPREQSDFIFSQQRQDDRKANRKQRYNRDAQRMNNLYNNISRPGTEAEAAMEEHVRSGGDTGVSSSKGVMQGGGATCQLSNEAICAPSSGTAAGSAEDLEEGEIMDEDSRDGEGNGDTLAGRSGEGLGSGDGKVGGNGEELSGTLNDSADDISLDL